MPDSPNAIVFIHGLWMTSRSWENWVAPGQSRGYTAHAPSWPGLDSDVEALNNDPTPLTQLGLRRSSTTTSGSSGSSTRHR